jgi:hypothetical protein
MSDETNTAPGGQPGDTNPQQSSWTAGILDPSLPGSFIQDWHTKAPEPAKLEPYKGAKNLEEFVSLAEKRVADAQAALRNRPAGNLPARPSGDAPPEAWAAYREAHGLPHTPEEYGIARPSDFPEQLWNDTEAAEFAKLAHEIDLKPEAVKVLTEWQQKLARDTFAANQKARANAAAALEASEAAELSKRFGAKLDGTLKELQSVAQSSSAPPSLFDPKSPDFLGVHAVSLFAKILERVPRGEDKTRQLFGDAKTAAMYDIAWAKACIKPGHPDYDAITNSRHPRHQELTELRNQAYALARGSE